jgi:hypothetical protein
VIFGVKSGTGTGFFPCVLHVPPVSIMAPLLHLHLQLDVAFQDKQAKHGNVPKRSVHSHNGEHCIEIYRHFYESAIGQLL